MTKVQDTMAGFHRRLDFTYTLAIAPWSFWSEFFEAGNGDFSSILLIFTAPLGLFLAPFLIPAGVVTAMLGLAIAILQLLVLPFQLAISAAQDALSDDPTDGPFGGNRQPSDFPDDSTDGLSRAHRSDSPHFPSLFSAASPAKVEHYDNPDVTSTLSTAHY